MIKVTAFSQFDQSLSFLLFDVVVFHNIVEHPIYFIFQNIFCWFAYCMFILKPLEY